MQTSSQPITEALKKIAWELKAKHNPLSFVIMTGKDKQGKSSILEQNGMHCVDLSTEHYCKIFYNQKGIILELGEKWFILQPHLLKNCFKAFNRCHPYLKLTAIILTVEVQALLLNKESVFVEHLQLLNRMQMSLAAPLNCYLLVNKIDSIAGFSEFFQNEHEQEINKELGFDLMLTEGQSDNLSKQFKQNYDQMIEILGQQIIHKIHPARSSSKRTLIREFPIQLLNLRQPLFNMVQALSKLNYLPQAIYFCSAVQGGASMDYLNQKIQREYELVLHDQYSQATNFKPYFLKGALNLIQNRSKPLMDVNRHSNQLLIKYLAVLGGLCLAAQVIYHVKTMRQLSAANNELLAYKTGLSQSADNIDALYHLSLAGKILNLNNPALTNLKNQLGASTESNFETLFLPALKQDLEGSMMQAGKTPAERYKALKIYLMLNDPTQFSYDDSFAWFGTKWQADSVDKREKKLQLLKELVRAPMQSMPINQMIVNDTRAYLTALPRSYLYYSLAKTYFNQGDKSIEVKGFALPDNKIPIHFTKAGYKELMHRLPEITKILASENWVLNLDDDEKLHSTIVEAYHYDYVTWWQNFTNLAHPAKFSNYQTGRAVYQLLANEKSLEKLLLLIQTETSAELDEDNSDFNRLIASQFTEISLMNQSSLKRANLSLREAEKFLMTVSVIKDKGKTAFHLASARFMNEAHADAISSLYERSKPLPKPVSDWLNQLADESWALIVADARSYINLEWKRSVFPFYEAKINAHYPIDTSSKRDISLDDFNHFFSPDGQFTRFTKTYIKPFLNTRTAEWRPKSRNGLMLPFTENMLKEMMRANVIQNMFFTLSSQKAGIQFSLQKVNLDPVIAELKLKIGNKVLKDDQSSSSFMQFQWPVDAVSLKIHSIEGKKYELEETGTWALFKLFDKLNLAQDSSDPSVMDIMFEINANSGRYLLKTANILNPFTPGIFTGFQLDENIV